MGAFSGMTAKRHRLWSNCKYLLEEVVKQGVALCRGIGFLHVSILHKLCIYMYLHFLSLSGGQLPRQTLQSLPGAAQGLVRKYMDKAGKRRHVGVASRLKMSQCLILITC